MASNDDSAMTSCMWRAASAVATTLLVLLGQTDAFAAEPACSTDLDLRAREIAAEIDRDQFGGAAQLLNKSPEQIELGYELKRLTWHKAMARLLVRSQCPQTAIEIASAINPPLIGDFVLEIVAAESAYAGNVQDAYRVLALIAHVDQWPSPRSGALMLVAAALIKTGKLVSARDCADLLAVEARIGSGRQFCAKSFAMQGLMDQAEATLRDQRFPGDRWLAEALLADFYLAGGDVESAERLHAAARQGLALKLWGGNSGPRTLPEFEPPTQAHSDIGQLGSRISQRRRMLASCGHDLASDNCPVLTMLNRPTNLGDSPTGIEAQPILIAESAAVDCSRQLTDSRAAECLRLELLDADKRINEVFRDLAPQLDDKAKVKVRNGQRDWLTDRSRQCRLNSKLYDKPAWLGDILKDSSKAQCVIRMTRERIEYLSAMLPIRAPHIAIRSRR